MKPDELDEKGELSILTPVKDMETVIGKDCVDFYSFEHEFLGDRIELKQQDDLQHLKLPNGVEITFGQIIALACRRFLWYIDTPNYRSFQRNKRE